MIINLSIIVYLSNKSQHLVRTDVDIEYILHISVNVNRNPTQYSVWRRQNQRRSANIMRLH